MTGHTTRRGATGGDVARHDATRHGAARRDATRVLARGPMPAAEVPSERLVARGRVAHVRVRAAVAHVPRDGVRCATEFGVVPTTRDPVMRARAARTVVVSRTYALCAPASAGLSAASSSKMPPSETVSDQLADVMRLREPLQRVAHVASSQHLERNEGKQGRTERGATKLISRRSPRPTGRAPDAHRARRHRPRASRARAVRAGIACTTHTHAQLSAGRGSRTRATSARALKNARQRFVEHRSTEERQRRSKTDPRTAVMISAFRGGDPCKQF